MLIQDVEEGDFLQGASGRPLKVLRHRKLLADNDLSIVINTKCGCELAVTRDHRINVPEDADGWKFAGKLHEDDWVCLTAGGLGQVSSVRMVPRRGKAVYQIQLSPDEPIEAFHEPVEKILSFGWQALTRRGGRKHRHAGDQCSIPETDDGFK